MKSLFILVVKKLTSYLKLLSTIWTFHFVWRDHLPKILLNDLIRCQNNIKFPQHFALYEFCSIWTMVDTYSQSILIAEFFYFSLAKD